MFGGRLKILVRQCTGHREIDFAISIKSDDDPQCCDAVCTAWDDTGKLVATLLTPLLGLTGGGTVVDEPITLALGTYTHCPPPLRHTHLCPEGEYNRVRARGITTWLKLSNRLDPLNNYGQVSDPPAYRK